MHKPIILHYHRRFFASTETFIYNYISRINKFHPLCFAWRYINLSNFPLATDRLLRPGPDDSFIIHALYNLIHRTTSFNLVPLSMLDKIPLRLIHAHFGPQGVSALHLKQRYGVPLCTTFYGYDVSQRLQKEKWRRSYTLLFQQGDLFFVEGAFMRQALINAGCPPDKIKIQRIAIPLDKIPFRKKLPKKKGEKVKIILFASLNEKKGHLLALKALNLIKKKAKNFVLEIYGNGPMRRKIKSFIAQSKLEPWVKCTFATFSYDEYLRIMSLGDIFLHPSVTASNGDSEGGAPTAILEAQAMGMPVVSTLHADIPNIVIPSKSAILSPENDAEALAQNLLTMLDNQDHWAAMGETGRQFVEAHHDINKEVVNLEAHYERLLNLR